jgi:hypothetical protein
LVREQEKHKYSSKLKAEGSKLECYKAGKLEVSKDCRLSGLLAFQLQAF